MVPGITSDKTQKKGSEGSNPTQAKNVLGKLNDCAGTAINQIMCTCGSASDLRDFVRMDGIAIEEHQSHHTLRCF